MHHSETSLVEYNDPAIELDARGLACPLPLLKAKQELRHMVSGQILKVIATDQGSVRDFRAYAEISGNKLINQQEDQGIYIHWLIKV
jgi:tRNA 2-thiouridine synthesizing protein A